MVLAVKPVMYSVWTNKVSVRVDVLKIGNQNQDEIVANLLVLVHLQVGIIAVLLKDSFPVLGMVQTINCSSRTLIILIRMN